MKVYLVIGLVVLFLSGALWYSIERNIETAAQLASTSSALDLQTQEANATKARLTEMTKARDRLAERLRRIEATEADLETALEDEGAKRSRLEKDDEVYRDWASADLPDSVVRMLRASPLHREDRLPGVREHQTPGGEGTPPQQE